MLASCRGSSPQTPVKPPRASHDEQDDQVHDDDHDGDDDQDQDHDDQDHDNDDDQDDDDNHLMTIGRKNRGRMCLNVVVQQ